MYTFLRFEIVWHNIIVKNYKINLCINKFTRK
jgi:hypothetical protein